MTKSYINACLRWFVNECYPYYEKNSIPSQLKFKMDVFYDSLSKNFDWAHPTKEELTSLGFLNWEESGDDSGVWFIPQWMFPAIPDGCILYDQHKNSFEFKQDVADTDTMFGCLRYGVIVIDE